jgi:hypothetical protein
MCRNFTYEVVGQRGRLKAIKKIVPQKINVILFFDIELFKYFFRVLHEGSSSLLNICTTFNNTLYSRSVDACNVNTNKNSSPCAATVKFRFNINRERKDSFILRFFIHRDLCQDKFVPCTRKFMHVFVQFESHITCAVKVQ